MSFLENKIPPPLVMLTAIAVMWLMPGGSQRLTISGLSAIAGIAVMIIGVLVAFTGVRAFRVAATTINPLKPDTATNLVTKGVFDYTRNPMYLGMVLVLIGNTIYLENPRCVVVILAFVLFMNRFQIVPEERAMQSLFGESFTKYCAQVRRWL